jgi:hypothetical protein
VFPLKAGRLAVHLEQGGDVLLDIFGEVGPKHAAVNIRQASTLSIFLGETAKMRYLFFSLEKVNTDFQMSIFTHRFSNCVMHKRENRETFTLKTHNFLKLQCTAILIWKVFYKIRMRT